MWLMSMIGAVVFNCAPSDVVLRGPYVQFSTEQSVVLRWRTSDQRDSVVWYGTSPGQLTSMVQSPGLRSDHAVEIDGLDPDSRYFYAVGSSEGTLVGDDADHWFRTHPPVGTRELTRFWAIGDSGTGNEDARAVRDAFLGYGNGQSDAWVTMGDNAYLLGTDSDHQRGVFDMYPMILRQSAMWPTLGNHDVFSADVATESGPYFDIFSLPRDGRAGGVSSGTEAYYSFDYANVHVVCLDSSESDRTPGSAMLSWLEADLAATDQDWLIGVWHHPAYSDGHISDEEIESTEVRTHILAILEAAGVDLVLAGHTHALERSMFINGHYGLSGTFDPATMAFDTGDGRADGDGVYVKPESGLTPNSGTVYVVAGSSSRVDPGDYDHPVNIVNINELGSMVIDVDGDRLDAVFLNSTGAVRDRFTIMKGIGSCGIDFAPDGTLDFFDVSAFIERLNAKAIAADLNNDARWDFFDVAAFIAQFNTGCP